MNRHTRIDEENWQENSDKKNIILVTILILTKRKLFQRISRYFFDNYYRTVDSILRTFETFATIVQSLLKTTVFFHTRAETFSTTITKSIPPPNDGPEEERKGTARMVRDLETFFPARSPVPCSLGKSMGMKEEGQRSGEITFE